MWLRKEGVVTANAKRGLAFYLFLGALLLATGAFMPKVRVLETVRLGHLMEPLLVPSGAVRDSALAAFTFNEVRLARGDSLDLMLAWMPPARDGADTLGAVDSLVVGFYYVAQARLAAFPLFAIDRTWTQRVPLFATTDQAWARIEKFEACAVIHRTWPTQGREVWGALTCGRATFIERRRYDSTLRIYREEPGYDFGPDHNTYPPRVTPAPVDSIKSMRAS
jgi:hypothetical protein